MPIFKNTTTFLAAAALMLMTPLAAMAQISQTTVNAPVESQPAIATANLESRSNSKVKGTVSFQDNGQQRVKISYKITGLKKNSENGFHIHEKGDCSSFDAKSAGAHYAQIAPTGGTAKDSPGRHAGDLPMIKANQEGVAEGTFEMSELSILGANAIDKKAIIVHGGPDDASKKSPPRLACGVIQASSVK